GSLWSGTPRLLLLSGARIHAEDLRHLLDRRPTFRNPFSSANCGRRWGGPWSRGSPAIVHAKAHEPPAGGRRAIPRGLFWGLALRVRLWACWFERRRLGYRQRRRPIELPAAPALGMGR